MPVLTLCQRRQDTPIHPMVERDIPVSGAPQIQPRNLHSVHYSPCIHIVYTDYHDIRIGNVSGASDIFRDWNNIQKTTFEISYHISDRIDLLLADIGVAESLPHL